TQPRASPMGDGTDSDGLDFPVQRVKKLFKALLPEGTQVDDAATTIIARATELFLADLTSRSAQPLLTPDTPVKELTYTNVADAVHAWSSCDFLHERVPHKVKASSIISKVAAAEAMEVQVAPSEPSEPGGRDCPPAQASQ
ncbi:hypothetical protein QJQ45_020455, partial [Haematococcus lacustris]